MKRKTLTEKIEVIMRYTFIFMTVLAMIYGSLQIDGDPIQWEGMYSLALAIVLFALPTMFSKRTKIKIPAIFQITFLLFIFASLYLGEVHDFYYKISWWDSMLHSSSAVLLGYIGFLLIFTLNRDKNIHLKLSPFFIALFTFCFAMTLGTIWEVLEFLIDEFFGVNMQKARYLEYVYESFDTRLGVLDTMKDIIVNSIGALFVSIMGYFYCKKNMIKEHTFWKLKDQFIKENPDLFKE